MKLYLGIISENTKGYTSFEDIKTHISKDKNEIQQWILNTVNPIINKTFSNIDDLENYLIRLEDNQGYAPKFNIEIKNVTD